MKRLVSCTHHKACVNNSSVPQSFSPFTLSVALSSRAVKQQVRLPYRLTRHTVASAAPVDTGSVVDRVGAIFVFAVTRAVRGSL